MSFYHVPHCEPTAGIHGARHNLGQHVTGDEIRTSAFVLPFGRDLYCEHLCVAALGKSEKVKSPSEQPPQPTTTNNHMVNAIRQGFYNNWLLDGLPGAFQQQTDEYILTKYAGGFPLGYINAAADNRAYIYNHVNLEIHYHPVHEIDGDDQDLAKHFDSTDNNENEYRIVRFIVEPLSIQHHYTNWGTADLEAGANLEPDALLPKLVRLARPTASCAAGNTATHTRPDQLHDLAQVASGPVLFTYDVIWVENLDVHWGERWDIYLNADG